MSITDELRKWAHGFNGPWRRNEEMLLAIADRIDAEHDEAIQQALMGEGSVPATDERMAEHGWVRLPLDADGEYIHIGDVMEWPTTGETFEVVGIGEGTLFYVDDGSEYADWTGASTKRHHHAPTVEDVLTEFGIDWEHESDCEDRAALLKEYAAKLRLAETEDA